MALLENKTVTARAAATLRRAYHYLDITQISEDAPLGVEFFRHINKGAWPFSTKVRHLFANQFHTLRPKIAMNRISNHSFVPIKTLALGHQYSICH